MEPSRKHPRDESYGADMFGHFHATQRQRIDDDGKLVIRCLLDAKKAGSLIGKAGAVINSFRDSTGMYVWSTNSVEIVYASNLLHPWLVRQARASTFRRVCPVSPKER